MKKKPFETAKMSRKFVVLLLFFVFVNSDETLERSHERSTLQSSPGSIDYESSVSQRHTLLNTNSPDLLTPQKTSTLESSGSEQISGAATPTRKLESAQSTQSQLTSSLAAESSDAIGAGVQTTTTSPSEEYSFTQTFTQSKDHSVNPDTVKMPTSDSQGRTVISNTESEPVYPNDFSFLPDQSQPTNTGPSEPVEGSITHLLKSYSGFLKAEAVGGMGDYGREMEKSPYDDNQRTPPTLSARNQNAPSVGGGFECPPALPPGSVGWQKGSNVVMAFLPHLEPSICDPPLKCNVSTTVHRHIYLQEGDSLQVMLQRPPHLMDSRTTPPPSVTPAGVTLSQILGNISPSVERLNLVSAKNSTRFETKDKNLKSFVSTEKFGWEKNRNLGSRRARRRTFDEFAQTLSSLGKILNIERGAHTGLEAATTGVKPEMTHKLLSPLTIWKVTEHEWGSCSTREGGQVSQSEEDGVANISDTFLPAGTQYFIGRSSWSSSECFKLKVVVRPVECGDGSICAGKGICYANATMERFSCNCCQGYTGRHCEERDACKQPPCLNAGICLDIQEGHDGDTFQCLCPYGYRGRLCETPSSLCDSNPCQNGGFCEGNHTSYMCHCPLGWTGAQCMQEKSEPYGQETTIDDEYEEGLEGAEVKGGCSNGPCIHGVCVETTAQEYRCFCQPGFGGDKCELEYDECYSNPCHNGGTCVDQIGAFQCLCGPGFTGDTCLNKINLCEPDPCPTNRICLDKGNTFTCECLPELTNEDCGERENICSPNPCAHGGSCYTIAETLSFYCACRPGFTGQTCQGIDRYPLNRHSIAMGKDVYDNRKINIYGDASILESVGPYGTREPDGDLGLSHSSIPNSLLHMKNMYTGAVTLASAFLIFLLVVSVCHCRVNRPSRNCLVSIPRPSVQRFSTFSRRNSLRDKRRREDSNSLHFDCEHDGASVPMTSHGNSDALFYNMDVCDNQELPLIK